MPGITLAQLADAQRRTLEVSERFGAQGKPVRYIRCAFIPGESRVMCLFEAHNAGRVMEINEAADFPFLRVVEAWTVHHRHLSSRRRPVRTRCMTRNF